MNYAIEQAKETHARGVAVELHAKIAHNGNCSVMIEMQEGKMSVLFSQHKKDRIKQVKKFGHPVPPAHAKLPQRFWSGVTSVGILPNEEALSSLAKINYAAHKEGIDSCHAEVVHGNQRFELVQRWSIGH